MSNPILIDLGTAANFGILAASTITNTGFTVVQGYLGLSPGTSIVGFPPGISGGEFINDPTVATAQSDLLAAIIDGQSRTPTQNLTGQDLGGLTLTSGVYKFNAAATLTGTLILDWNNDPNSVWIFQIGSTFTTITGSDVIMINKPAESNNIPIFWVVGSSATLGVSSTLLGTVLANVSITATTGAISCSLLTLNGAVTLDTNTIGACPSSNTIICFNSDVSILSLVNNQEIYVPISNLQIGDLIKTYQHGYQKISFLGSNTFINDPNNWQNCMYTLPKKTIPGQIQDLTVTGGHSTLIDTLTVEEMTLQANWWVGGIAQIDDKYRLLAHVDTRFQKINHQKLFTYYHFSLSGENEVYGIWANGVLTETCKKEFFVGHFSNVNISG